MTGAFLIGSLVLLDAILILWLKTRLQKIDRLPWWYNSAAKTERNEEITK